MSGIKHDAEKPMWDLLSPTALSGVVDVLTFGAQKYAKRNWEQGISYSRVFAALMRHMWAWWKGEDLDPETGLSHLDHAACCVHFLQHYVHGDYGKFDDRPKPKAISKADALLKAERMLRRYGELEHARELSEAFQLFDAKS